MIKEGLKERKNEKKRERGEKKERKDPLLATRTKYFLPCSSNEGLI